MSARRSLPFTFIILAGLLVAACSGSAKAGLDVRAASIARLRDHRICRS